MEVIETLKRFPHPDRPVHRIAGDTQHFFQFFQQIKGLPAITIQLVDEGEDRDIAVLNHFKEFFGLGLDTLGRVHNHHGRIHGHQGPIGILGEILVSRRIQNIDPLARVIKLHDR